MTTQTDAITFFRDHAGLCIRPDETEGQARDRCAREYAEAERWGSDVGLSFHWEQDDITSAEFTDEEPAWRLWRCLCRDIDGKPVGSLCGIDFGPDGEPWGETYRRVVEAELASEARAEMDG